MFEDVVSNILFLDKALESSYSDYEEIDLIIVGGAFLLLENLPSYGTYDIDIINNFDDEMIKLMNDFSIYNGASEVVTIHWGYKDRMRLMDLGTERVNVYLLSYEDWIITKVGSWRREDKEAIEESGILDLIYEDVLISLGEELASDNSVFRVKWREFKQTYGWE